MFKRFLQLDTILKRKSLFLFGPRQTGKSTYLKTIFPEALNINLLKSTEYRELLNNPENLNAKIIFYLKQNSKNNLVIIDEVQKIPELLDTVHDLIEANKNLRFILTGSSTRKLKRVSANMLGGRAALVHMFPITAHELKTDAQNKKTWTDFLTIGSLPSVLNSEFPFEDLSDYISAYLKNEIEEEGLSRSIGNFSRFLNFSALRIGEQLNFTSLASDAQISPILVKEYFQILSDTLIGHLVEPFNHTKKRKAMMTSKFYFFDMGLANALVKRASVPAFSNEYGILLENFIHNEMKAYLSYTRSKKEIQFWRSTSKLEVDFIIWDNQNYKTITAVEVKSTVQPNKKHLSGLNALSEEFSSIKKYLVCQCTSPMEIGEGVQALPVELFLNKLWNSKII